MKNFFFNCCSTITIPKIFFLLLTIALLSSSQSLFSQCKLDSKTDEFSSIKTINSQDITLVSIEPFGSSKGFWNLDVCFVIYDNTLQIKVTHASQTYSSVLDYIYFKFKDGTLIKKTEVVNTGDYSSGHGYKYSFTTFSLTKDELMKFASTELEKFQAEFTHFPDYAHVEKDVKAKSVDKISKDANCVLSEFNTIQETLAKSKENSIDESDTTCKYEKDLIDEFTKKRIVLTAPSSLFETRAPGGDATGFTKICGSNINGVKGLKFSRGLATSISFNDLTPLKEGLKFDQVDLLLENEDVISLKENDASEFVSNSSVYSSFKIFTVNDDLWNKLKSTSIKKIRISLNNKEIIKQEIDKKYSKSILKVINCIEELNIPK